MTVRELAEFIDAQTGDVEILVKWSYEKNEAIHTLHNAIISCMSSRKTPGGCKEPIDNVVIDIGTLRIE